MTNTSFLKPASLAAFATALTTLGIHLIDFQADIFGQRLLVQGEQRFFFRGRITESLQAPP